MTILNEHKFIEYDNSLIKLTDAGINATQVQEFHSLVSAEIIQKLTISTNTRSNNCVPSSVVSPILW